MKTIIIKNQSELDALPAAFDKYTIIEIRSSERIYVRSARGNSSVEALENSSVVARGNSSVVARGNSSVEAWENSSVVAWESSSVEAWENSSVEARGNSSVEARGNSSVVAWENSSVEARGNSSVVARGNSSVVALENSSVVAWGNSSVEARGNSSVVARGNSSVVAWGNSCVHAQSDCATITLFMFAACFQLAKAAIKKASKTASVIVPTTPQNAEEWLTAHGVKINKGKAILFKRVSENWLTQENTSNETAWNIGATLEHPAWNPTEQECGGGKFHFCPRPFFCDEFRSNKSDKYIALELAVADLYVWTQSPDYPHKIAGRRAKVLYQVNKTGAKIKWAE